MLPDVLCLPRRRLGVQRSTGRVGDLTGHLPQLEQVSRCENNRLESY
jgi:hypothetical protein